jgi:leucyl aminopeptidase
MKPAATILIMVLGVLALARGKNPSEERFTSAQIAGGRWSDDGREFFWDAALSPSFNISQTLVMVSFNPLSSFGSALRRDPRMQAYFSSPNSGVGRAVLSVHSAAERDALAMAAHEDIHTCGGLELLDGRFPLSPLGDAASPMIATTVASSAVKALLALVTPSRLQTMTADLEAMGTRYHAGSQPNQISDLIWTQWQSLAPSGATVSQVSHATTSQKSVVIKIPGTDTPSETVVLGAHMDSINHSNQNQAPGADDNASGLSALTEILRIIKTNHVAFSRNLELHAYAAEEVGLLGSADLAANATASGKKITAMLQLDMIAYTSTPGDQTLHLITTDTSPVLTRHLKDLIALYLDNTWSSGALAAGTSDHRSWYRLGFHAAFAFEHPTQYNRALHTSSDTSNRIDFNLAARFTKLALAFAAHEAGVVSARDETEALWTNQLSTANLVKLSASRSSSGGYRLGVALTLGGAAASAELCQIGAGMAKGCRGLLTSTQGPVSRHNKTFFATSADMDLADGDLWRVNIYDQRGILTASRSFKLRRQ